MSQEQAKLTLLLTVARILRSRIREMAVAYQDDDIAAIDEALKPLLSLPDTPQVSTKSRADQDGSGVMGEPKWTPGPWHAERAAGNIDIRGEGKNDVWIAQVMGDHHDLGIRPSGGFPSNIERGANAAVMAAAPDLAAACRGALAIFDTVPLPDDPAIAERRTAIVAALARAEGRS